MAKTREELLALAVRQYEEVDGIRLQSLTELETSDLESLWNRRFRKTDDIDMVMRRELLVRVIVDSEGNRMFQDNETDLLGELPSPIIVRLYRAARALSGMDRVEDTEKNSVETTD